MELSETSINCPYCGEHSSVLVDDSEPEQEYIEDCQVCCRPITIRVSTTFSGEIHVDVFNENDAV